MTLKQVLLAGVIVVGVGVACGSMIQGAGTMSAKVDGKDWSAATGTVSATATGLANTITISGANSATDSALSSITFTLNGAAAGTYNLDASKNVAAIGVGSKTFKNQATGGGKVEITKFDDTAEGTFEVTAVESGDGGTTLTITNGTFSTVKL